MNDYTLGQNETYDYEFKEASNSITPYVEFVGVTIPKSSAVIGECVWGNASCGKWKLSYFGISELYTQHI